MRDLGISLHLPARRVAIADDVSGASVEECLDAPIDALRMTGMKRSAVLHGHIAHRLIGNACGVFPLSLRIANATAETFPAWRNGGPGWFLCRWSGLALINQPPANSRGGMFKSFGDVDEDRGVS